MTVAFQPISAGAYQRDRLKRKPIMIKNRGAMFLIGAAASAWQIYDLATETEAPSQTLAVMQYGILAVLIVATVCSGAMWITKK
jgi:hypothetical protein